VMGKNRLWVVGAVTVMAGIIGVGWLVGISPELSAVNSANQDRANVVVQNGANEALLAKLKKDFLGIDAMRAQMATLQVAVPSSAQMSTFVAELNMLAATHQVTVKSISVSDAKPYTAAPTPVAATGTPASKPVVMTNPKITPANFVVIPIQISVTGIFAKVLDFLHDVQGGPRLFLASTLTSTSSTHSTSGVASVKKTAAVGPTTVDSTIGGFVYVLLDGGKTTSSVAP
jgi:Tfp pilus assembly protein PilO